MPGEILAGRYRLDRELARGGMGVVAAGFDLQAKVPVAVKLVDLATSEDTAQRRFNREIVIARSLQHPNIVRTLDSGTLGDGRAFIVMEYLEGRTLGDLLESEGRLTLVHAAIIAEQLLAGLAHAHAQKIVHRDLKPANVFLQSGPQGIRVKLLDFGIARSFLDPSQRVTATGGMIGTTAYMAPEALFTQVVSPATDMYAVGLIMYELVAGKRPRSSSTTLIRHIASTPQIPARIWDTAYGQIMVDCLRKSPAARPHGAQVSHRQLAQARRTLPDIAISPHEIPPDELIADEDVVAQVISQASVSALGLLPPPACYGESLRRSGPRPPPTRAPRLESQTTTRVPFIIAGLVVCAMLAYIGFRMFGTEHPVPSDNEGQALPAELLAAPSAPPRTVSDESPDGGLDTDDSPPEARAEKPKPARKAGIVIDRLDVKKKQKKSTQKAFESWGKAKIEKWADDL